MYYAPAGVENQMERQRGESTTPVVEGLHPVDTKCGGKTIFGVFVGYRELVSDKTTSML